MPSQGAITWHDTVMSPEQFSEKIITDFYVETPLSAISTTEYTGTTAKRKGDTVHVPLLQPTTITRGHRGERITYQEDAGEGVDIVLDQEYSWARKVGAVNDFFSQIAVQTKWGADAAGALREATEQDFFSDIHSEAAQYNYGTTGGYVQRNINLGTGSAPVQLNETNILPFLGKVGVVLSERKTSKEDRWIVLPECIADLISNTDAANASFMGDGVSMLRKKGAIGMLKGFTIFSSNNLKVTYESTVPCFDVVAGWKGAIAFVAETVETKQITFENEASSGVRSTSIAGWKVVRPKHMVNAYVRMA